MKEENALTAIIVGRNKKEILPLVRKSGFKLVTKKPNFVISFGGDGTLMLAEHMYPEIPKIVLRDSLICKKCSVLSNKEVLASISKNKYHIEELIKLEASGNGHTVTALNDIIVHNANPRHAIRYLLSINDRLVGQHIIGDGIAVATPFGSTAYYRSITDSFFEVGIGLAFNNSTEQSDHMVLREDSVISMKIIRGPAVVYADNQESTIDIETHGTIEIRKSARTGRLVVPEK